MYYVDVRVCAQRAVLERALSARCAPVIVFCSRPARTADREHKHSNTADEQSNVCVSAHARDYCEKASARKKRD